jgi:ADP-ribose pyrophosphatase YjhB (NUDIX family)
MLNSIIKIENVWGKEMIDYIVELRRRVGSMPINLCAVGTIVLNEKNEILLIRRTDNKCWALPAGCLELGENIEAGARREVLEETGLVLGKIEFVGVYSGKDMHYTYPNGDEIYAVTSVFKSNDYFGTVAPDGVESKEVKFFDKNNIPENLHRPDIPVIVDFVKNHYQ